MEEFLADVREETVVEDGDRIAAADQHVTNTALSSTPKIHSNRKVFVEKPTRFVQIDANKLRYLLDERKRTSNDVEGRLNAEHPLLNWAVKFQRSWSTWTLFLAGILAGFGTFQLVLLGVLKHQGPVALNWIAVVVDPSTTIFNFLYVWALLGSLEKCDFAGLDVLSLSQEGRFSSICCAILYLAGLLCSLTVVHLDDLREFSNVWFALSAVRSVIPILCWMFLARNPDTDAFARRLSTLRLTEDETLRGDKIELRRTKSVAT